MVFCIIFKTQQIGFIIDYHFPRILSIPSGLCRTIVAIPRPFSLTKEHKPVVSHTFILKNAAVLSIWLFRLKWRFDSFGLFSYNFKNFDKNVRVRKYFFYKSNRPSGPVYVAEIIQNDFNSRIGGQLVHADKNNEKMACSGLFVSTSKKRVFSKNPFFDGILHDFQNSANWFYNRLSFCSDPMHPSGAV